MGGQPVARADCWPMAGAGLGPLGAVGDLARPGCTGGPPHSGPCLRVALTLTCVISLASPTQDIYSPSRGSKKGRHPNPHVCSQKSDVWSFGVLLYRGFPYGQCPYTGGPQGRPRETGSQPGRCRLRVCHPAEQGGLVHLVGTDPQGAAGLKAAHLAGLAKGWEEVSSGAPGQRRQPRSAASSWGMSNQETPQQITGW